MDFSDCPFALWSGGDLAALNSSAACSVSSFGSRSSFAGTSSFYSSSAAPSSYCSSLCASPHALNAQTYERIYNEFRKWMLSRYSANPDYVEADMELFRDEWERFVRSSLRAEHQHRLSLQITHYERYPHVLSTPSAAAVSARRPGSGKWSTRLRKLRHFWPAERSRHTS